MSSCLRWLQLPIADLNLYWVIFSEKHAKYLKFLVVLLYRGRMDFQTLSVHPGFVCEHMFRNAWHLEGFFLTVKQTSVLLMFPQRGVEPHVGACNMWTIPLQCAKVDKKRAQAQHCQDNVKEPARDFCSSCWKLLQPRQQNGQIWRMSYALTHIL